jgi:hypothetical protein
MQVVFLRVTSLCTHIAPQQHPVPQILSADVHTEQEITDLPRPF